MRAGHSGHPPSWRQRVTTGITPRHYPPHPGTTPVGAHCQPMPHTQRRPCHAPRQAELAVRRQHDVLHEVRVASQRTLRAAVVITLVTLDLPHDDRAVWPNHRPHTTWTAGHTTAPPQSHTKQYISHNFHSSADKCGCHALGQPAASRRGMARPYESTTPAACRDSAATVTMPPPTHLGTTTQRGQRSDPWWRWPSPSHGGRAAGPWGTGNP